MMSEIVESSGKLVVESGGENPDRVWIDMITPGWGSSGYYSQEVLERDMPKIYPKGSHMYIDHPTMTEMHERPERSVKELAAVTTETARWSDEHQSVGAYAELFPDWAEPIKAKSKAIGVSIFADGEVEESDREIEGKAGPIIHSLTDGFSVDFVTQAGRGGKIGESGAERPLKRLLESAREEIRESRKKETAGQPPAERSKMDELERVQKQLSEAQDQVRQLEGDVSTLTGERDTAISERDEARTERDRAQDAIQLAEASRVVETAVKEVEGLPERAVQRAIGSALREGLPVVDGKLDKEVLQERAKKSAQEEIDYLTESGAGNGSGSGVSGLGSGISLGGDGSDGEQSDAASSKKALAESLQRLGMSEDAAKVAAEGR